MRIRSIRPEFWTSEDIAAMDWNVRLVFIGLWSYVDDNGVGRDNERLITTALFPLDEDLQESSRRVTGALRYLSSNKLITRYEVSGKRFLHISSWLKHQRIEKASKGRYPLPTCEDAETVDDSGNTPGILPEPSPLGEGEKGRRGEDLSSEPDGSDSEPNRVDVKRLTDLLVDSLKARNVKTPTSLKAWNTEARRLLDIDKRPLDEALRVLAWSQQDEFWSKNILAMSKFRAKYDQLRLKADTWQPPVGPADRLKAAWRDGYDRELDQLASEPFYIEWPDPMPLDRDGFRLKAWRSWIESRHDELLRKLEARAS